MLNLPLWIEPNVGKPDSEKPKTAMEMLFANMITGQNSRQPKIAVAISDVHAELARYKNEQC